MTIASLLVHVDSSTASIGRLRAALHHATRFQAHLTALFVVPTYSIPEFVEVPLGPDIIEEARKAFRGEADQVKRASEELASKAGVQLEWQFVEGNLISTLNEYGRYTDMLIVGQHDEDDPKDTNLGVVDHVVLECGTPCLIIPYIGAVSESIDTVLVAWNGSLESARAIKYGLPFMKQSKNVHVLSINPERGAVDEGDIPGADISAYLARHGLVVESHAVHNTQIDTGDVLLSYAADLSADLIVAGAYGHNRLREKILGGVTRHLLNHMTVPVLMSH